MTLTVLIIGNPHSCEIEWNEILVDLENLTLLASALQPLQISISPCLKTNIAWLFQFNVLCVLMF